MSQKKQKNTSGIKAKGALLNFGVMFVVSAWMFFLGVLTGRGCAPLQVDVKSLQSRLAELSQKEQKYYKINQKAAQDKSALGFYEALKKTEKKDEKNRRTSSLSSKKPLKNKTRSVPETNADKKPDTGPEKRFGQYYTIQAAALKESMDADKLVVKLKQKGYHAYKIKVDIPGKGTWFRVRVGSYKAKADAMAAIRGLKQDKFKALLVAVERIK